MNDHISESAGARSTYPLSGDVCQTNEFLQARETRKAALRNSLRALFPESVTITLELGCGHGHFLTAYANEHPQEPCLGIDLIGGRIERADKKRRRHGLLNAHFLRCGADELLECLPDYTRLGRIFALFPDPWPKRRHWKHRMLGRHFLNRLSERAGEGSRLYFRTDDPEYCKWARAELEASRNWILDTSSPWPFEHPTVFQEKADHYQSLIAKHRTHAIESAAQPPN